MDRAAELRDGLAETRRYLLSHHVPAEYDRCHRLRVGDRTVRVCARCAGIYPGIVVGVAASLAGVPASLAVATASLGGVVPGTAPVELLLLLVLPAPALVDWAVTTFRGASGHNAVRTATGASLGVAYGLGLVRLFGGGDPRVLVVGAAYGVVAGWLLWRSRRARDAAQ